MSRTPKRGQPTFSGVAVTVSCSDQAKSAAFYEQVLGARLIRDEVGTCPWYQLGSLKVTLCFTAEMATASAWPDHAMFQLWVETDDICKARELFQQKGVEILEDDGDQWMVIGDPDGLLIEVWQATGEWESEDPS